MQKEPMTGVEVLRDVMKEEAITQKELSDRLGYSNPSAITNRLNSTSISMERFVSILSVMGYEVVVRKNRESGSDDNEWIVAAGRRMRELKN